VPTIISAAGAIGLCAVPWMPMVPLSTLVRHLDFSGGPPMAAVLAGAVILLCLGARMYRGAAGVAGAALISALYESWMMWSRFGSETPNVIGWGMWAHPAVALLALGGAVFAWARTS